jgi:hypothetical protein
VFVDEICRIADALTNRIPSLVPRGVWNGDADAILSRHNVHSLFTQPVVDEAFARACLSGLHQWNDQLGAAHTLAMSGALPPSVAKSTLDYWHGIMHRREPDFPNAKYWFRQVGDHPLYPAVLASARRVVETGPRVDDKRLATVVNAEQWDPFSFVDLCQRYAERDGPTAMTVRSIQAQEMTLLLSFSAQRAFGES